MPGSQQQLEGLLQSSGIERAMARSIIGWAKRRAKVVRLPPEPPRREALVHALVDGVERYANVPHAASRCKRSLDALFRKSESTLGRLAAASGAARDTEQRVSVAVLCDADVLRARSAARQMATRLGFRVTEQVKIATAVSELARNIVEYAGSGAIYLSAARGVRAAIELRAEDEGPGIENLEEILAGRYRSRTGMGLGILGCKRLMDEFEIEAEPQRGTRVCARKYLL